MLFLLPSINCNPDYHQIDTVVEHFCWELSTENVDLRIILDTKSVMENSIRCQINHQPPTNNNNNNHFCPYSFIVLLLLIIVNFHSVVYQKRLYTSIHSYYCNCKMWEAKQENQWNNVSYIQTLTTKTKRVK